MPKLAATEIKAFVPARDFALSKRFYTDLGFTLAWSSEQVAYLHCGQAGFLLQNFYVAAFADNLMMQLTVEDLDAWWTHVQALDLPSRYGIRIPQPPADQPWAMRDFVIIDPSGVLWRIGQNIPAAGP